jgi:endonuclease YncB( thermonuclease family)
MRRLRTLTIVGLLIVAAAAVSAETISGRVVGITDGDTLRVLAQGNLQYVIRLAGIDAPEHNQAFGTRSKQNLSRLAYGKEATLECGKKESYGRLVCKSARGRA